jgi:DNA-binding CsgD family transcriptional regulator
VDWSHALLTEPEQVLLRRLAVFAGGFDLDAAQAVGASSNVETYQLLDQLSLLVDKSLVVAFETSTDAGEGMRYRLLETVRQYAQEKLGESGEADDVRTRHRDYYTDTIAELHSRRLAGVETLMRWVDVEIPNLRAAFTWSRENSDLEAALRLASSLQQFWLRDGSFREALAGFDAVLTDRCPETVAPDVWARGVADHTTIAMWIAMPADLDRTEHALAVARQLDDPELLVRLLIACGAIVFYNAELAGKHLDEAIDVARTSGDDWALSQIFSYLAATMNVAGEPIAARAVAEQGRDLSDALGDQFISRGCRAWLGVTLWLMGDLAQAAEVTRRSADDAEAAADLPMKTFSYCGYGFTMAHQGRPTDALAAAQSASQAAEAMGWVYGDAVHALLAMAALAGGDAATARQAAEDAFQHTVPERFRFTSSFSPAAEAALACGDLAAARQRADQAVAVVPGAHQVGALTVRGFVALAQGEPDQAERDAHDALTVAARTQGYVRVPYALECLARVAAEDSNHPYAARLLGAADAIRQRTGHVRFPMYEAGHETAVTAVREALGQNDFDAAWTEGHALSIEEAIAYAQRGRGERKRPSSGWGSLTPMELDVVGLVREGLGNKEIGARLFISPRTVQTHLTHVYAKLGVTSRVQLVQEAGRRSD